MEHPPAEAWTPFEATLAGTDIDPGDQVDVADRLLAGMPGRAAAELRVDGVVPELPGFGAGGFWEPVRWRVTGALLNRCWRPRAPRRRAPNLRHSGYQGDA